MAGLANSSAAPPTPDAVIAGITELPGDAFSLPAQLRAQLVQAGHPKLDTAMHSLASASKISSRTALERAGSLSLRLSGQRVHAQIAVKASGLEAVRQAVAEQGGEITGVGNRETLLQGWLPISALDALAGHKDVLQIRRPEEAVLLERALAGASTTEGLAAINGWTWHASGYTGAGVKVGVIDNGFLGYPALQGTDLPVAVTVKNFVDGESDALVDGTTDHGTACAEIVHDIAPDATLYLAKISTNIDLQEAVAWLKDVHQVDVISVSMGWYITTPGDGTGQFADLVASARSAGITWVTAAGNERERHWGGTFADSDGDDFHEFNGAEVNCLGPEGGTTCYNLSAGVPFLAQMRWNDWTHVDQDYALTLLRWNGAGWDIVGVGNNPQTGSPGQRPAELVTVTTSGPPTPYAVAIARVDGTRPVNFELFVPKLLPLKNRLTARSLANLADVPDAITVAALDVDAPYPQENYSSEGPTNGPGGAESGGAIKPDLAGYANVSTESYGSGLIKFNGTSAATPHVAGAAALVKSAYPSYTPDQVEAFLQGRAVDMGPVGKDTAYGWGRLHLGVPPSGNRPPYTPSSPSPTDGALVTRRAFTLSWTGDDPDPGDTVTYDVYLDVDNNTPETLVCDDVNTTTCAPGALNSGTQHYWKVIATDDSGASTTGPIWRFRTAFFQNSPPNSPRDPRPTNGAFGVPVTQTLSWTGGDLDPGDTVTYDVYLDVDNNTPETLVCDDVNTTTCAPGQLAAGAQHYWKVTATDDKGASTTSLTWSFSTEGGQRLYLPLVLNAHSTAP
jgi:subtilisin family serine protease